MGRISESVVDLVQNPFGNYAVTEVLICWDFELCLLIYDKLRTKVCQLSSQKFSSNVIEKCLEKANLERQNELINELARSERLCSNNIITD